MACGCQPLQFSQGEYEVTRRRSSPLKGEGVDLADTPRRRAYIEEAQFLGGEQTRFGLCCVSYDLKDYEWLMVFLRMRM